MIRSSGHRNRKKPFSCDLDTEESGLAWSVVTNLFGKGPVHLSQVYTFLLLSRSHEKGMLYIFFKKVQFYQFSFNKQTWLSMDNKLNEGSKIVSYYFGDEVEIHLHTPTPTYISVFYKFFYKMTQHNKSYWMKGSFQSFSTIIDSAWLASDTDSKIWCDDVIFFFQKDKNFCKDLSVVKLKKKELIFYQTFYNKYLVHLHFFIFNYSSLLIHSKRPKFNLFALGMVSFLKFRNYVKVIIQRQGRGARNVGSSDQRASSSLVHKLAVSRAVT